MLDHYTDYSLTRNMQWVEKSRDTLSSVIYTTEPHFNSITVATRKAFDLAEVSQYQEAVSILTIEKNQVTDPELRGLIKQYIAEYTNFFNSEQAQQILLSANSDNRMLIKPIQGIQFNKIINKTGIQAQSFINYMAEHNISPNSYLIKINALLEKLVFNPDTAKQFEAALRDISFLIGIYSNRPEDETGKGPDNFWDIGNSKFLVIECKNGTITDTICKHDCNQLNGSIIWFNTLYRDDSCSCFPLMIHNSDTFEYACSPNPNIKIMTPALLKDFRNNIHDFSINAAQNDSFCNSIRINELLSQFKLLGKDIFETYSKPYNTNQN